MVSTCSLHTTTGSNNDSTCTDPVAGTTTGTTPAQGTYHPFRDSTLSIAERVKRAGPWLSFYFNTVPDLDSVTDTFLASRVAQAMLKTYPALFVEDSTCVLDFACGTGEKTRHYDVAFVDVDRD